MWARASLRTGELPGRSWRRSVATPSRSSVSVTWPVLRPAMRTSVEIGTLAASRNWALT